MPGFSLRGEPLMACDLSAAACFARYVTPDRGLAVKQGNDGWWSMRCPAGKHGKPLRLRVGDRFHIFWTDLGECPEADVFGALVRLGIPGECLKRPKGSGRTAPEPKISSDKDVRLADAILDIAFSGGTTTERMVAMVIAALDGELPTGPMVGVFAAKLGVSERTFYRVTEQVRRRSRDW